ncbi:MAG: hypothetical protein R3B13_31400 [Polyangiaceae bacterium]
MLTDALAEMFRMAADERGVRAYSAKLSSLPMDADDEKRAASLEATLEAMYLMAASDGEVAQDELLHLSSSLKTMLEAFGHSAELTLPLLHLNEILGSFHALLERDGLGPRLESVAERLQTPEARCLAFSLAAAIAFVDDFVAAGEADAIDQLAAALGLSPEESQHLMREVHARLNDE